jgi:hypothetical protein
VFEKSADYKKEDIKIIFFTRLWSGSLINETRIEIIRKLRKAFKTQFVGGIQNSDLARQLCPDLIVPNTLTRRFRYLNLMHSSDICIGTTGLFNSIGGKTGEYIAASRAIVHENLHYSVPGNFKSGQNYMRFSTVEQCIEQVNLLVQDPHRLYQMKNANEHYYNLYLKPDRLALNTLKIVQGG